MKFFDARGCTLEQTARIAQKEDVPMSRKKSIGPTPVLASAVVWKTDGGPVPVVRLTGLLHTIFLGPDDLPRLEEAVRVTRQRINAAEAEQAQGVAA